MNSMRKVLITGAAGFVGSNLSEALVEHDYSVVGLDNLSMGSLDNFGAFLQHPHFCFIRGDVTDLETVRQAAKGCDVIVHLAAFKIPRYGGILDTLRINEIGSRNILEAAKEGGAKVVMASTSDVYGKNPDLPFREDGATVLGSSASSRWGYAVSKLFSEHMAFGYFEAHGVKTNIIRIFGSYGPRQHLSWWGGPQSVFISSILQEKPVEIHGDGLQTRSFCYVSDLVSGFLQAIEYDPESCEIFNVGAVREISILDLARLIKHLIGGEGDLELRLTPYSGLQKNYEDVRRRIPDISKAQHVLNYQPKVSLEEGLRRTIDWQRSRLIERGELEREKIDLIIPTARPRPFSPNPPRTALVTS